MPEPPDTHGKDRLIQDRRDDVAQENGERHAFDVAREIPDQYGRDTYQDPVDPLADVRDRSGHRIGSHEERSK